MEKIDTVSFELVAETEFWIYIHDEGAEYFLHYDYWPRIPAIHQVKIDEIHLDLMVRKNVEHSDETCFSYDESYTYFGKYQILEVALNPIFLKNSMN